MSAEPLLRTTGLTRRFGGVTAVDGVDFALAPGELRCLIGPNGAGKSTFFKMLTGQLKPSSGAVHFAGRDITAWQSHAIARLGVGIKTQVPSVFDGLSVRENLALATMRKRAGRALAESVEHTLQFVRMQEHGDTLVGHLAHGQRQWVELGMVLAVEPTLVLLDEPTAGMTRDEVARTAELIRDINRGRTLIVVEHDMQFVRMIARLVTVFHQGHVIAEGDVETVLADATVRNVYLGRRAQHA